MLLMCEINNEILKLIKKETTVVFGFKQIEHTKYVQSE